MLKYVHFLNYKVRQKVLDMFISQLSESFDSFTY